MLNSPQAFFKVTAQVEADIDCDDEALPFRLFTFFFVGTVDQIALGFRPTYLALRKRGFFHVLGALRGAEHQRRPLDRVERHRARRHGLRAVERTGVAVRVQDGPAVQLAKAR